MRRISAFFIMIITLIATIAFAGPSINQNKKLGMDFKGGFEILYEIEPMEGSDLASSELTKAASLGIEKRLQIGKVLNSTVGIEGGNFIRVGIATASVVDANKIKTIIETNSEITFRDFQNNLLATGDQILKENAAVVKPSNQYQGLYDIEMNISDQVLLEKITGEISEMDDNHLVVWFGFVEGVDDYANKNLPDVGSKIIYDVPVENALNSEQLRASSQNFNKENAEFTATIINSGTFEFETNYKQLTQVSANKAEKTFLFTLISIGVALLFVFIALTIFYKKAGLISSLSIAFFVFLSLVIFNLTNGIYSISSVAGLIVGIALAIDGVVVILERVKKEVYAGKQLNKAYQEGYKKAFSSVLDANIATFILGVILFFVGNSTLKSFSGMLLVGVVAVMISVLLINNILLTVFSKTKFAENVTCFGAKKQLEENKDVFTSKFKDKNVVSHSKKYLYGIGILAVTGLIMSMIFGLGTNKNFFNLSNEFREGSEMIIETKTNHFSEKQIVIDFMEDINIVIETDQVELSTVRNSQDEVISYVATIRAQENILQKQSLIDLGLIDIYGENTSIETNYTLNLSATSSEATNMIIKNAAFATLIATLVIGLYLTLRYKYTYGIAAFVTILINLVSLIALFALFRLQIGVSFIPAVLALIGFSVNSMVTVFTRIKEFLINKRHVYVSNEERNKAINNALSASVSRFIISNALIFLFLLVTMIIASSSTLMFNIAILIGIGFASLSSFLVAPALWLQLEKRKDKKKRTFKPKDNTKLFKEKEERTFIGFND